MRYICLIAVILLAACSSQPPQTSKYLLRSSETLPSGTLSTSSTTALDNVQVAAYIAQPGLVLATGDGKITAARHHLWAEPLQVSLRRFLAVEIAAVTGGDITSMPGASTDTRINVMLDQLHGDDQGDAVLVAFWEIVTTDATRSFEFSQSQPLATDGYDALVRAEQELLKRLAGAIAASLEP